MICYRHNNTEVFEKLEHMVGYDNRKYIFIMYNFINF